MHKANKLLWEYVNTRYNNFFEDEIIEFGSYDMEDRI